MPALLRYWIYGTVYSLLAVAIGLTTSQLFDFNWAIVSLALLAFANVFTLSSRHHHHRPNLPPAPTQAGTTLTNAIIAGEKRLRYVPNLDQPTDRYTWFSQPTLVAAAVIVILALLI